MRVLLTHGYSLSNDAREQEIMRPYVPLGILYISAWLETKGVDNHVIDSTFMQPEEQWEAICNYRPEVIGIYVNLMTRKYVVQLIKRIRSFPALQNTRIILGGPEVRNHAQNWLHAGADVLVVGEGEVTFHALVTQWHTTQDLFQIPGIYFTDDAGSMHFTGEREKIKHIDELPFPNRKKVDLHLYLNAWKQHHGVNAISISTMRGCPYTCHWCSRAVYGASYRRRSPERVVEEMMEIQQQYHPDTLWFVDDVFTISHKWLESFAACVRSKGLHMPFECITRADRMDEHVIHLLKASGCVRVWIGAESGSQRIIDAMDRRVEVGQVQQMIRLTRQYGIEAGTFIMLGYPGETESDIMETVHHLKAALPDHFTITTAYPIKGTELYTEVQDIMVKDPAWEISSDRDIKFKRTYPESYYPYAVRFVVNEVHYAKTGHISNKIKSIIARSAMWFTRTLMS